LQRAEWRLSTDKKMKVTWETSDIIAGRRIKKPGCGLSGEYIIGYMPEADNTARYVMVALSDGMVSDSVTKLSLANTLTVHGYLPIELTAETA
jgi:hypothetical protein